MAATRNKAVRSRQSTSNALLVRIERAQTEYCEVKKGPVAQRLEQGTHNPLVPGSNPGGPSLTNRATRHSNRLDLANSQRADRLPTQQRYPKTETNVASWNIASSRRRNQRARQPRQTPMTACRLNQAHHRFGICHARVARRSETSPVRHQSR